MKGISKRHPGGIIPTNANDDKSIISSEYFQDETEALNSTGRDRIHALDLAQRAYQMRLELLANSTVVENSVRFIEAKKNAKPSPEEEQQQLSEHFGEASEETETDDYLREE